MGNGQSEEINCEDEELVNEYIELKGGRKRLSVQEFSKRVSLKMERENRPISASHEDTLQELFHDKTHIGFEEYLTWKVKTGTRTELPRLLTELFKAVDENVDGELSPRELVEVETKLGRSITEADAEDIIKTWDCNGDGKMDINEFIEYKTATMRFSL